MRNSGYGWTLFWQTKKGVKRKADTTTPGALIHASSPYDPTFEVSASIKAQTKQLVADASRNVKKVRKDSFDDSKPYNSSNNKQSEATSAPLDFCREILKELFGKKHAVSLCNRARHFGAEVRPQKVLRFARAPAFFEKRSVVFGSGGFNFSVCSGCIFFRDMLGHSINRSTLNCWVLRITTKLLRSQWILELSRSLMIRLYMR